MALAPARSARPAALPDRQFVTALARGLELLGGSPEEFAVQIKSDTERWDVVSQAAGLGK